MKSAYHRNAGLVPEAKQIQKMRDALSNEEFTVAADKMLKSKKIKRKRLEGEKLY